MAEPDRAYNLGNLWRRLVLPTGIDTWSLTSLQQRLVKTGGRLIKHARYYCLLLAEGHLTRRLFAGMLRKIAALPPRRAELASCGTVGTALHSRSYSNLPLRTAWSSCDDESISKTEIPAYIGVGDGPQNGQLFHQRLEDCLEKPWC